ncbi:nucleoside-diphosphate kinase [Candidatus Marsarchaeota archaeon]|jgi:nucleoside-diphosphate kinase|nr:nucleoside-diphosphate kinase [Candidatus Marsarchaeota archaeon]
MIKRVLVLVKPDGVYKALIGKAISMLEAAGLKVVAIKMVKPDKNMAAKHYIADEGWLLNTGKKAKASYLEKGQPVKESELEIGKRVHSWLLDYIISGPVVAIVFEGNEAPFIAKKLLGPTEPRKADPSTFRGKYSSDSYDLADARKRAVKNLVHISDEETAEREIHVWFKDSEISNYKRIDEDLMY